MIYLKSDTNRNQTSSKLFVVTFKAYGIKKTNLHNFLVSDNIDVLMRSRKLTSLTISPTQKFYIPITHQHERKETALVAFSSFYKLSLTSYCSLCKKYKNNPIWIGGYFNLPDIDWSTKSILK